MANASKMARRRRAFWTMAGLAGVAHVPLISFLAVIAAALSSQKVGSPAVGAVACALEGISLVLLTAMMGREAMVATPVSVREQNILRSHRRRDVWVNATACFIGSAVTFTSIAYLNGVLAQLQPFANLAASSLLAVNAALAVLVFVFETVTLGLLILEYQDSSSIVVLPPAEMIRDRAHWSDNEADVQGLSSFGDGSRIVALPPKTADSCSASFRSSFTDSTRPSSSKKHQSSSRPSTSSQSSQFDTWDTSTVPPPLRDTVHNRVPTILPPIPGSRPESPARALDGPFLPESPHPSQMPIDAPSPTVSNEPFYSPATSPALVSRPPLHSSSSNDSLPRRQFPPPPIPDTEPVSLLRTYSQTSLADSVSHLPSRRLTTVPSEENIHPLFRLSSATPPPAASVGTVLTAASIEDALGKRRTASTEALRTRAQTERGAASNSLSRSSTTRSRAGTKTDLTSPLVAQSAWVAEREEPPSPERQPSTNPTASPPGPATTAQADKATEVENDIPDYMVVATADPQLAAFARYSTGNK